MHVCVHFCCGFDDRPVALHYATLNLIGWVHTAVAVGKCVDEVQVASVWVDALVDTCMCLCVMALAITSRI